VTKSEQETTIRWAADEEAVSVWTAQPPVRRKLEKAGYRPTKTSTVAGEPVGWFFTIPVTEFRWRVGAKKKRTLTPAQRQAAADRMAAMRGTAVPVDHAPHGGRQRDAA
jgi:hypothetical protein